MISIDQLNHLNHGDFVGLLGGVYELSPWVAEAAWHRRPFSDRESLIETLRSIVDEADGQAKLELLRAHPDLAGKLAVEDRLTEESRSEQASLGLDRLSADDFEALSDLNGRYRRQFGFPFIVCVRNLRDIPQLLATFRRRIGHDDEDERRTALSEVHAIARLRVCDLLG